jgi:hypothetical protein
MTKTFRVRCIQSNSWQNGRPPTTTVGRIYEATESADKRAWIITNDQGRSKRQMPKHLFEMVN